MRFWRKGNLNSEESNSRNAMIQKLSLTLIASTIFVTSVLYAQYRSIDFDINRSAFVDDYRDTEFDYVTFTDSGLVQWGLSGSYQ